MLISCRDGLIEIYEDQDIDNADRVKSSIKNITTSIKSIGFIKIDDNIYYGIDKYRYIKIDITESNIGVMIEIKPTVDKI